VPAPSLAELFRVAPLPRWRAVFALICAAAAFLSIGGMLEYGTGSPETRGSVAASYWALLFALHVVAFGGAGLIAAFPALARPPIKLGWIAAVALVYALAFAAWYRHQPQHAASLSEWLARWPAYFPAALAVVVGLLLPVAWLEEHDNVDGDVGSGRPRR
jgi:hypothetical protein